MEHKLVILYLKGLKYSGFLSIVLCLFIFSCNGSIVHLNTSDFLTAGNKIEEMNSATFTQYIGHSRDRVYLEYFSAIRFGKNKTIVYWTEIDQLPDSIKTIIKDNKNPWIPWLDNNRKENDKNQDLLDANKFDKNRKQ